MVILATRRIYAAKRLSTVVAERTTLRPLRWLQAMKVRLGPFQRRGRR